MCLDIGFGIDTGRGGNSSHDRPSSPGDGSGPPGEAGDERKATHDGGAEAERESAAVPGWSSMLGQVCVVFWVACYE